MIVTPLLVLFSIITNVHSLVGRCYLCSEETLAECIGSEQSDSPIYTNVLQYYTEPCNGQCVLFRDENQWTRRGCSWTYGHMTSKSIGWHEISPGIKAYFCHSHLCNNGTYEQMKMKFRLSPLPLPFGGFLSRSLRQCYVCTARFQGCGEFLNPHYASRYIRSCPTSCIIFRNPTDLHLITRDCALFWPQVRAETGLHKVLGSDAYLCQESLCNGISFDFIMGIFHNQLPTGITFPPIRANVTTSTTNQDVLIETTTLVLSSNSTDYLEATLAVSPEPSNSTLIASNDTDVISIFEYLSADEDYFIPNHNPWVMPPFSWMLSMAVQNTTQTTTTTTEILPSSYGYCNNKQCHSGGHLNSDCLCICLPTFTGENCETVLCDEEPNDICAIMLEDECQLNSNRYLCPKFCQFDTCLPNQT